MSLTHSLGIRNPRLRELVATVPAYARRVRAGAIPAVAALPPVAPGGVVQLWPLAFVGGAERAMLSILKATPDLPWRGVAIAGHGNAPEMVGELRAATRVAIGPDEARALVAGADVVLAWWTMDLASWLPAAGRRPVVVMVSHSPAESPFAVRLMADDTGVDRYVAVSRAALGPIPAPRRDSATIIPNAIDVARLAVTESRESVRASWGLPDGAKVLGGLNRLSHEKRTENLVDAVALLPPEWSGVVVGEGRDRAELEAYAAAKAPGRVRFPGARMDVGNVLNAFDRLVVASEYESFCLSMAEALHLGVPVISTPVGIAAEHPGLVRLLPPEGDGAAIAAAALGGPADPSAGMADARRLWGHEALGRAWDGFLRPLLPAAPALVPLSENLAMMRRINACPSRGCRTGCGTSRCDRDGRSVTLADCRECLTA